MSVSFNLRMKFTPDPLYHIQQNNFRILNYLIVFNCLLKFAYHCFVDLSAQFNLFWAWSFRFSNFKWSSDTFYFKMGLIIGAIKVKESVKNNGSKTSHITNHSHKTKCYSSKVNLLLWKLHVELTNLCSIVRPCV